MQKRQTKFLINLIICLSSFIAFHTQSIACEYSEYNPTPEQRAINAVDFYEQETVIYEAMLLGSHDYETGGKLLILRSYKGPAKPFDIIDVAGGSSCYGGITPFDTGFYSETESNNSGFDGFISNEYVVIWKQKGLIDDPILDASQLKILCLTLISFFLSCFVFCLVRRNKA